MKKNILILVLFPFILISQSDTNYNKQGDIISVHQKGITQLVNKYENILKNIGGIEGWRIQIKFKAKREDILPYQIKFTKIYPEIPAQITFDSPYYKLTIGNYRTRNEALKVKHKISKHFPGAHPIPIIINPNLLD